MSDVILRDTPKPYFEDDAVQIYLGDCRDVLPLLNVGVDLVLTDPPYGVGGRYGAAYDDDRETYWDWFLPTLELMRATAPVVAFTHKVHALQRITGWDWVASWYKPAATSACMGNSPLFPQWEPIFLFGIHSRGVQGGRSDVFVANPEGPGSNGLVGRQRLAIVEETAHPRSKPLALFKQLVGLLSDDAATVLDPFMGSGTTLRAAKDLGRKAIGIEIEEKYCEIAAKRMAQGVLL